MFILAGFASQPSLRVGADARFLGVTVRNCGRQALLDRGCKCIDFMNGLSY